MIPQTGLGRFLFFLNLALLFAMWLVPLAMYSSLPERVAVESDHAVNPDNYSDRATIWLLPTIGSVLWFCGLAASNYVSSRKLPGWVDFAALTEKGRRRVHDVTRELLLSIFAVIELIFIAEEIRDIVSATTGRAIHPKSVTVGAAFLIAIVAFLFIARMRRVLDAATHDEGLT